MKKQIFRSIFITSAAVLLSCVFIFFIALYAYFSDFQMRQLRSAAEIAADAVEAGGIECIENSEYSDYRITYISSDGSVLYDSKAGSVTGENYLEREEISKALSEGVGESSRYSDTLMQRQLYCAKRLSDGSVLRLASEHLTWWTLIYGMLQPIFAVALIALILSILLSLRLSKKIVAPLNSLNTENPSDKPAYEELSPLVSRIGAQQDQLKKQKKELERKKEEFNTATENMAEGIVVLNKSGAVLSINGSACKTLGITKYSIGKDLLLFNNSEKLQALLKKAGNGEHAEKTVPIDGKNYQLNANPVITNGKVRGITLVIFDITEKEKAEAARREFTANVSHELKTPLQTISGCAELLAGGMVKNDDIPKFADKIHSEAIRMISMVEDIIKLSHLDEQNIGLQWQTVDLYETAKSVTERLAHIAKKSDIAFELVGEQTEITAIPQLIDEIVYNLCDNAIKYNHDGGRVKIEAENHENSAALCVSDTGIGIPENERERIFERFYMVDKSHSKEIGGTGLGLSIVKHAAIIHGAEIDVKSEFGKGTSITVTFPKTDAVRSNGNFT